MQPTSNGKSSAVSRSFLYHLPNRFRGAAFQCFHTELDLLVCHWLTKHNAKTKVVITTEKAGRKVTAAVAVDATAIDVETSGDILRESVFNGGHG